MCICVVCARETTRGRKRKEGTSAKQLPDNDSFAPADMCRAHVGMHHEAVSRFRGGTPEASYNHIYTHTQTHTHTNRRWNPSGAFTFQGLLKTRLHVYVLYTGLLTHTHHRRWNPSGASTCRWRTRAQTLTGRGSSPGLRTSPRLCACPGIQPSTNSCIRAHVRVCVCVCVCVE